MFQESQKPLLILPSDTLFTNLREIVT